MSDVVIVGPFTCADTNETGPEEHGVAPRDWLDAPEALLNQALASFDRLVENLEGAHAA